MEVPLGKQDHQHQQNIELLYQKFSLALLFDLHLCDEASQDDLQLVLIMADLYGGLPKLLGDNLQQPFRLYK